MRGGLYRTFYPHTLGHWLGLDVHDAHFAGQDAPLRPGVILTVEPGLYIPNIPERYGAFAGLGECASRCIVSRSSDGLDAVFKYKLTLN
jgi:hypothetical protein